MHAIVTMARLASSTISMQVSRYSLRCLAVAARALGMLMISAATSVAATFLSFRLLSTVIGVVGPLCLILAILATVVGLAEFMHLTQQPDEEAAEYVRLHPLRD